MLNGKHLLLKSWKFEYKFRKSQKQIPNPPSDGFGPGKYFCMFCGGIRMWLINIPNKTLLISFSE